MSSPRPVFFGLLLLACVATQTASHAHARDEPPRLTDRGRLLLAGSFGGYWSNNADSPGLTRYPTWSVWTSPSLLYFVRDRLGLGAYLDYSYRKLPGAIVSETRQELGGGIQAAYELAFTHRLGWLLTPQLGYERRWRTASDGTDPPASRVWQQRSPLRIISQPRFDQLRCALFAPIVYHVSDSVGIGLGPWLYWDFYIRPRDLDDGSRYQHLRVGASSWIGGSF
ncbi:MAG: hypothetical protein JWN04_373 [Myxococcaceae bacterium]|nr:hypothetical protein [Myxococcaceae bacterium]